MSEAEVSPAGYTAGAGGSRARARPSVEGIKRGVGWILCAITIAITLANQEKIGLARDEIVYMQAGMKYADWWSAALKGNGLSHKAITQSWGGQDPTANNREHPPLMKTAFGISQRIFHQRLGVNEITAFRIPTAIAHGVLVLLVFGMVIALWGFTEALLAALFVMFLPRALFHAGLACFDAPITALWFATIYAYWRALDGRKWPWLVGLVFGLALATKHNALLLPFAISLHYMIAGYRHAGMRGVVTYRWRVIVSFVVLSPVVLLIVWPWLWLDPIGHLGDWLEFHLKHVHYNYEYLGENWNAPRFPWHTALVTTSFTVPVVTLLAGLIGACVWFARRREVSEPSRLPGLLLLLSAAASIGPFFLGTTPIFGAEKHWMPALPSLCIVAGVGTAWAARQLAAFAPSRFRGAVVAGSCALVVGAALVETVTAQPYALTSYNALAGGAPGGADLGMNRQFWGTSAAGVIAVLREDATRGVPQPVYSHDASPAWGMYIKHGYLPPTLADAGREEAGIAKSTYALVIHERHFNRHDYLIWKAYGTVQPMFVLRADGVPIVTLYKRPSAR